MTSIALQIATERLKKARIVLASHEAALAMHRDHGDGKAVRSAQARVNGLRTVVGGAESAVRRALANAIANGEDLNAR